MPFVQCVVEPIYLSRKSLRTEDGGFLVTDDELDAVANNTLSNVLRQLASVVLIANDIFENLKQELNAVTERSQKLAARIATVGERVLEFDPRTVTVPESDICSFSLRKAHFSLQQKIDTELFTSVTRPKNVQKLYDAAAKTPVHIMRQMDKYRCDGHRSSKYFTCTPVLGVTNRKLEKKIHIDIETRKPAVLEELRQWTSAEALGDVTVTPDCTSRITTSNVLDLSEDCVDGTDHQLPSPEEQVKVVARQFPPEMVCVDTSGRAFHRMCVFRRSLIPVEFDGNDDVRRRRNKKLKGKRRNTIAGTGQKELEEAIAGETQGTEQDRDIVDAIKTADSVTIRRSFSSNPISSKEESPTDGKKSHFSSLKQWGKTKLKLVRSISSEKASVSSKEFNIYETVTAKNKRLELKSNKKQNLGGSKAFNISLSGISSPMNIGVKLRENSILRWHKKNECGKEDPLHSSSGNWSASSESRRASVTSENTSTTPHPKSSTLSSAGTSSNSLNHHQAPSSVSSRRLFLNSPTSSSFSEGTLTPDIIPDMSSPFSDDGETSSVYSCDTEGYYTSFHMDSGLKTLKEEDVILPQSPLQSTTALSSSPNKSAILTAENEYELFGKGSTSTTTSSAGTVCTTLMIGNENNSNPSLLQDTSDKSLSVDTSSGTENNEIMKDNNCQTVTAMIHKDYMADVPDSPDSGHNTSSSPYELSSSPHGTFVGRNSECEFSESDLEGVDRIERMKVKTAINSSRIPLLCVITPPQSDDEFSLTQSKPLKNEYASSKFTEKEHIFIENGVNHSQVPFNKIHDESITKQGLNEHFIENDISKKSNTFNNKYLSSESRKTVCDHHLWQNAKMDGSENSKVFQKASPLFQRTKEYEKFIPCNDYSENSSHPLKTVFPIAKDVSVENDKKSEAITFPNHCLKSLKNENLFADKSGNITDSNYTTTVKSRASTCLVQPSGASVQEIEYVSLSEIPSCSLLQSNPLTSVNDSVEVRKRHGARVTLDSEGKVIYSSDSLRRMKGMHSTFEPGPYVKQSSVTSLVNEPLKPEKSKTANPVSQSPSRNNMTTTIVFPSSNISPTVLSQKRSLSPRSPQLGKVIIRANSRSKSLPRDGSYVPASLPASPTFSKPVSPRQVGHPGCGAYVNVLSSEVQYPEPSYTPGYLTSSSLNDGRKMNEISSPLFTSSRSKCYRPQLLSTSFDESSTQVKRSDSYKMANSPFKQVEIKSDLPTSKDSKKVQVYNNETKNSHNSDMLQNKFVRSSIKIDKEICKKPDDVEVDRGKSVFNPNVRGRKFYGVQVKMDPHFLHFNNSKPVSKESQETSKKETKVMSAASNPGNNTDIW